MRNKVALLTGATSGIGEVTAHLLAERGVKVVLSGRRRELGEKVVQDIVKKGGEATFVQSDVAREAEVDELVRGIVEKYGRLDMAVNNAGISNETLTLADSITKNFQAMLDTNVLGVYLSMKAEIRQMLKNGGGSIVNLASI